MKALCRLLAVAAISWPGLAAALGPSVVSATLPNGATLLVSEQRNVPIVLVWVLLDAGARRDPEGRAGLANLTADLLAEGTTTRNAAQISEAIDFIGGSLDASASTDYAAVSLRTLRKHLDAGLDLLADILLRPVFAADELVRRREAALASIRAARDDPTAVAAKAFLRALFGDEPYGYPVEGIESTVGQITRADIQSFYERFYRPGRAAVVVVGDISANEARRRVEKALASWQGGLIPPFEYRSRPPAPARTVKIDRPVTQASIILGQLGVARNNPDYEALTVMDYVLGGGGFSSRLMESIRTESGLAYSVSSYFTVNQAPGSFQIVMQTKNASVAEAISRAQGLAEGIRTHPITDGELEDAKRYLTGSFPLRLDSNAEIAEFIGQVWLYGLGEDYADVYVQRIAAVTKDDVLRVARQYLHPERFLQVVVADLAEAALPDGQSRAGK